MYKFVFGGLLPRKPKPFHSSLCITAAFLAWFLVRDKVVPKFSLSKSHQFTSVFTCLIMWCHLFFSSLSNFQSGNIEEYECLMAQLAILFISWQRKHYYKSTLSFLSDLAYHIHTFLHTLFNLEADYIYK